MIAIIQPGFARVAKTSNRNTRKKRLAGGERTGKPFLRRILCREEDCTRGIGVSST